MTHVQPVAEIVADENNRNGESPVWDAARGRMLWVDNITGDIFAHDLATRATARLAAALPVCGLAINHDLRLVIAGPEGILLWDDADGVSNVIAEFEGLPLIFNDITVSQRGDIYGGTFYWGANGMERHGKLYLIRRDGTAAVLDEGIALSNGLGFSPDGRVLYFTDTMDRKIYAYDVDVDTVLVSNRRAFVTVPREEGLPDGLEVDADGYIWSALWYGGEIVRYDPEGTVERRIRVPAQQVSSIAFGGADLNELYITTAGEYWPSDKQPIAFDPAGAMGGPLYRVRPGVCGRLPNIAQLDAKTR